MPAPGVSLETLDEEIANIVAGLAEKGIDAADIERAKSRHVAETIYAQDNQGAMAQWYGASLDTGLSLDDIQSWPSRIEAVTADDVLKAAHRLDGTAGRLAGRCRGLAGRGLRRSAGGALTRLPWPSLARPGDLAERGDAARRAAR